MRMCVCGWFAATDSKNQVWLTVSACLWQLVCSAPNTNMIRLTNHIAQAISPPVLQYKSSSNEGHEVQSFFCFVCFVLFFSICCQNGGHMDCTIVNVAYRIATMCRTEGYKIHMERAKFQLQYAEVCVAKT